MQLQHQKIALDVNDTRAFTILNAHQGDSKTRFIDITLTENGNTITLSSNCVATVKASINGKTKAVNTAVVNSTKNVITVELTKTMLDTPGLLNCEVILQEGQQFVTSATFTVKVAESVISDESAIVASQEFGKLLDALIEIKDIEDKAERVQTLVNNIDKLKSADDIINRLSTSETNIETNKASIKELSELVQEVKNSAITEIESLKANKLDKTDFNSYKTSNDNAVNSKVDTNDFNTYKTATDKAVADNTKSIKVNTTAIDKCITDIANNSDLISKNQINVTTDKSTSIVLNDSSDCNITALTLHGNSVQSAVPTPTAPANIDNVTNPKIKFFRKNLFDFSVCNININDLATINSVDRDNCTINFTTSETSVNSGIYIRHTSYQDYKGYGVDYTKLGGKPVALSFDVQSDINCKIEIEFIKASYKYFDITSEKQRIVVTDTVDINKLNKALCFYTNKTKANITISNIQIEVNNTATDYEVCDVNKVEINCTLCKVNNISDTLTVNADGTGYITQNLLYEQITSDKSQSGHSWQYSTTSLRFYRDDTRYKANTGTPNILCSHFEVKDNEKNTMLDNTIGFTSSTGIGIAIRMLQFDGDISAFKTWLDNNEVYVVVPLKKPIITELSKEQVDKILSLHTCYPNTTVISDCDCQIKYVADTKSYIDNKFKELAQVIVASADESEVI